MSVCVPIAIIANINLIKVVQTSLCDGITLCSKSEHEDRVYSGFPTTLQVLLCIKNQQAEHEISISLTPREHVTDFDWFFPENKYKLDLQKTMYSPSSSDRPQVG